MVISTSVWLQVHASILYVVSNEMAGIFVLIQYWIVILYVLIFLLVFQTVACLSSIHFFRSIDNQFQKP